MNWEALGVIGEMVGAVAVIVTLGHVAVRVCGSMRASAVEAKLQSKRLFEDFIGSLIEAPELNDRRGHSRGFACLAPTVSPFGAYIGSIPIV
jgi:hypothetical protein